MKKRKKTTKKEVLPPDDLDFKNEFFNFLKNNLLTYQMLNLANPTMQHTEVQQNKRHSITINNLLKTNYGVLLSTMKEQDQIKVNRLMKRLKLVYNVESIEDACERFLLHKELENRDEEKRLIISKGERSFSMLEGFCGITMCGINIPFEIVRKIFSHFEYSYDLLCSVGILNEEFFLSTLLSWKKLKILKNRSVFQISLVVLMYAVEELVIMKPFSEKEFTYLFEKLKKNKRFNKITIDSSFYISPPLRVNGTVNSYSLIKLFFLLNEIEIQGSVKSLSLPKYDRDYSFNRIFEGLEKKEEFIVNFLYDIHESLRVYDEKKVFFKDLIHFENAQVHDLHFIGIKTLKSLSLRGRLFPITIGAASGVFLNRFIVNYPPSLNLRKLSLFIQCFPGIDERWFPIPKYNEEFWNLKKIIYSKFRNISEIELHLRNFHSKSRYLNIKDIILRKEYEKIRILIDGNFSKSLILNEAANEIFKNEELPEKKYFRFCLLLENVRHYYVALFEKKGLDFLIYFKLNCSTKYWKGVEKVIDLFLKSSILIYNEKIFIKCEYRVGSIIFDEDYNLGKNIKSYLQKIKVNGFRKKITRKSFTKNCVSFKYYCAKLRKTK